jgi:hypothetical protein
MKNLWNLVTSIWATTSRMTLKQRVILIGFTILPGASLILISSLLGQLIIRKQTKVKTSMTCGKLITNNEIIEQLYERTDTD